MAAGTMNQGAKKGHGKSGKLPTKQTINMAEVGAKPFRVLIAIPIILIILVALAVVAKFAVLDRIDEVKRSESEVTQLQTMLNASKLKLASYGDVIEKYAHYTYSGLTQEELSRVYNPVRGLLAPLTGHSLIILPALVCAAAALFDGGNLFDMLSPYLSLTTGSFMGIYVLILETSALSYKPFIVLAASLVFPLMVFLGYLYGRKLDQRTMQAIARSRKKAMKAGGAKVVRRD